MVSARYAHWRRSTRNHRFAVAWREARRSNSFLCNDDPPGTLPCGRIPGGVASSRCRVPTSSGLHGTAQPSADDMRTGERPFGTRLILAICIRRKNPYTTVLLPIAGTQSELEIQTKHTKDHFVPLCHHSHDEDNRKFQQKYENVKVNRKQKYPTSSDKKGDIGHPQEHRRTGTTSEYEILVHRFSISTLRQRSNPSTSAWQRW